MDGDRHAMNEYVQYVRELYDRLAKKQRDNGFTTWALLGALVYVFWQSVPMVAEARSIKDWDMYAILFCAHISAILLAAEMCFGSLSSSGPLTPYDYRLKTAKPTINSLLFFCVLVCLFLGAPLVFSTVAWIKATALSATHYRLLTANCWVIGVLFASALSAKLYSHVHWEKTGFPAVIALTHDSSFGKVVTVIFFVSFLVLLGLNLYFLAELFGKIDGKMGGTVLVLAANLVLGLIGLRIVVFSVPENEALDRLSRIERDALMHGLTASEVRARLESDYLGHQLGDWLGEKLTEIRALNADWLGACNRYKQIGAELDEIDPLMVYERLGRLEAYVDELSGLADSLIKKWKPLARWMLETLQRPGVDRYTRDLLKGAHDELEALYKATKTESTKTLDMLRAAIAATKESKQTKAA